MEAKRKEKLIEFASLKKDLSKMILNGPYKLLVGVLFCNQQRKGLEKWKSLFIGVAKENYNNSSKIKGQVGSHMIVERGAS